LHLARLERVVLIRGDEDAGVDEGGADGRDLAAGSGSLPLLQSRFGFPAAGGGGYTSPTAGL
jgi:hypothetical protein